MRYLFKLSLRRNFFGAILCLQLYGWRHPIQKEFFRFGIVGLTAMLTFYAVLIPVKEFSGWEYKYAATCALPFTLFVHFKMQRRWVFEVTDSVNEGREQALLVAKQFVMFLANTVPVPYLMAYFATGYLITNLGLTLSLAGISFGLSMLIFFRNLRVRPHIKRGNGRRFLFYLNGLFAIRKIHARLWDAE